MLGYCSSNTFSSPYTSYSVQGITVAASPQ